MLIKTIKSTIIIILKLLFIVMAGFIIFEEIDLKELFLLISSSNIYLLFIAFIVCNISLLISSYRSKVYFYYYDCFISFSRSSQLYYAGAFLNNLLPGGITGDGYRLISLSRDLYSSKIKAFRVILYERVNGFYALSVLAFVIFFLTSFESNVHFLYINITLLILVTPLYIIGNKYILKDSNIVAFKIVYLSFFVQILQCIMFYCIIMAFGKNAMHFNWLALTDLIFLSIIASIISILPISIGSIGVRELVLLYGLSFANYSDNYIKIGISIGVMTLFIYFISALLGYIIITFALTCRNINKK